MIYELQIKKVKNINLRIRLDGTVYVSAHKSVPKQVIDDFLISKADFIINALETYENGIKEKTQYFGENEIVHILTEICKKVYPYFEDRGIKFPQIKLRKMVSRWGSCNVTSGVLTFNTALMYVPRECIEYVVLHEFTHFLQANHSTQFYDELEKVCPKWKQYRQMLKNIKI